MEVWKEMVINKMAMERRALNGLQYPALFTRLCRRRTLKLLRVTAVLTAKDDGTQALGELVDGEARPLAPYLRNTAKHLHPEDNYVRDWITLANQQLLKSGASFALDLENLHYVLEKNTLLNTLECSSPPAAAQQAQAFFVNKSKESLTDNPYRDSVILLFRWGANPNQPAGQACSGVDASFIILNRYDEVPIKIDGQLKGLSNNQLSHEFGHFMGLDHPFIGIANDIAGIAGLNGKNPEYLSLTESHLAQMPGATAGDLSKARQDTLTLIKDWVYNFDQDIFGRHPPLPPPEIPDDFGVRDTPIDLGVGFPLVFGYPACSGSCTIPVELHDGSTMEIEVNDAIRGNVMSYWRCDNAAQQFSRDQVRRMEWVLENVRSKMVGRTISFDQICKPLISEELHKIPFEFPVPDPHPDWQRVVKLLPAGLRRNTRLAEELQVLLGTVPVCRPSDRIHLERYCQDLDRRGAFRKIPEAPPWGVVQPAR